MNCKESKKVYEMESDCILCGGCVDICPVNCLEIVELETDSIVESIELNQSTIHGKGTFLLIKKSESCIRCGLCVNRCPVGTFIMEEEEEIEN